MQKILDQVHNLVSTGSSLLTEPQIGGPMSTLANPILIDMRNNKEDPDEEIFGPVLKMYRFSDWESGVRMANSTRFGLSAGILCRERQEFDRFFHEVRAGIINWNQQLTGATTFAPFGGVKQSGNYRPAGFLSVDYSSYAVASFENPRPKRAASLPPGLRF